MSTTKNPPTTRAAPATRRLVHIDHLRVFGTLLVVAHHVALAYGNLGIWPNWQEPDSELAALPLDLLVLVNQTFFMGLFFMLSGFFAPGSVDRKGPGRWALDRVKRLGLPFVAFMVLLRPLYSLPTYLDQPPGEREPYWLFYLTDWEVGPMWFVLALLVLSLGYALVRERRPRTNPLPTTPRTVRSAGASAARRAPVPDRTSTAGLTTRGTAVSLRARHVVAFAIGLGVVSYVWRIWFPTGSFIPVIGIPSPGYVLQYVALFVVGILAFRRGWFSGLPRRAGLLGAGLVVASFVPMVLGGYRTLDTADPVPAGPDPAHLGFALFDALFAVGVILVLLRVFERYASRSTPAGRFLTRNAFGVYVVHAPVIVGVVALLGPLGLTPVVAFALALVISASVSWAVVALLRRSRLVREVI
ncbi:acyltransferase family protein [Georgenia sp. Z1344]|uniref:acyltransferase family protein n=1 Tax=Georgenia sp. Z1344 TaxID=3416706 RepID=UPI003CE8BD6B